MVRVATYVFIDLETTGLPREELNKTKIIELSMVAVSREHLEATQPGASPRVQDKLTLCFNPFKVINPDSTLATGLENELLESKTTFNIDVCNMINTFLKLLPKPVCLIAQNGMAFDFPIIKNHFVKLKTSFSDDVMCADCYHAFYDILEEKKRQQEGASNQTKPNAESNSSDVADNRTPSEISLSNGTTKLKSENHVECVIPTSINTPCRNGLQKNNSDDNLKSTVLLNTSSSESTENPNDVSEEDILLFNLTCEVDCKYMQSINETTPKRATKYLPRTRRKSLSKVEKVRRRIPWSLGERPQESYKLKDIYERLLNRPAMDAHRAENDCIYALEAAVVIAKEFGLWVDENCVPFSDIKPMTLGVPLGL